VNVSIELESMVPYERHCLHNPERVYVDLHGTRLAPQLANQVFPVEKAGLRAIRVAQTRQWTTRVVLDLEAPLQASVANMSYPDRLTLQLRAQSSPAPQP